MKYFTIDELCKSETAKAKNIENVPSQAVIKNLTRLIENVLDPLREAYGAPIHVNSGYRCPELNVSVGGSETSEHCFGMAADITAIDADRKKRKVKNQRLFELAISLGLPYHQLIDEYGFTWVHISFNPSHKNQREVKHIK